jgi:hypothetical protein
MKCLLCNKKLKELLFGMKVHQDCWVAACDIYFGGSPSQREEEYE